MGDKPNNNLPPDFKNSQNFENIQKEQGLENIQEDDAIKLAIELELNKLEEIEKKIDALGDKVSKKFKKIFEEVIDDIITKFEDKLDKKLKKEKGIGVERIEEAEKRSNKSLSEKLDILKKGRSILSEKILNFKQLSDSSENKKEKGFFNPVLDNIKSLFDFKKNKDAKQSGDIFSNFKNIEEELEKNLEENNEEESNINKSLKTFLQQNIEMLNKLEVTLKSIEKLLQIEIEEGARKSPVESIEENMNITALKDVKSTVENLINDVSKSKNVKEEEVNGVFKKLKNIIKNITDDSLQNKEKISKIKEVEKTLDKTIEKDKGKNKLFSPKFEMEKTGETFKKTMSSVGSILKGGVGGIFKSFGSLFKSLFGALKTAIGPVIAGFLSLGAIIINVTGKLKMFDKMYKSLGARGEAMAGEGVGETNKLLNRAGQNIVSLQRDRRVGGMSAEEAQALVMSSLEMRMDKYLKDWDKMNVKVAAFSKLSGISTQSLLNFSKTQAQYFGASSEQIEGTFAKLRNLQSAYKLIGEEMNDIINEMDTLNKGMVGLFDAERVKKFDNSFMKVAARFKAIGVDIGKASELFKAFIDPTAMEQSLPLLSKLGYSVQDILSGNVGGENTMNDRLKQFADQIATVAKTNRMQAALMTQTLTGGKFSLEDMLKISKGEKIEEKKEYTIEDLNKEEIGRHNTIVSKFDQLKEILDSFFTSTALKLFNSFADSMNTIAPLFEEIYKVIENILDTILNGPVKLIVDIIVKLFKTVSIIISILLRDISLIIQLITPIVNFLLKMISPILDLLNDFLYEILDFVKSVYEPLMNVAELIIVLLQAIMPVINKLVIPLLKVLLKFIVNIIKSIIEPIVNVIGAIAKFFKVKISETIINPESENPENVNIENLEKTEKNNVQEQNKLTTQSKIKDSNFAVTPQQQKIVSDEVDSFIKKQQTDLEQVNRISNGEEKSLKLLEIIANAILQNTSISDKIYKEIKSNNSFEKGFNNA